MRRTRGRALWAWLGGPAVVAAGACASTPDDTQRSFVAGERVGRFAGGGLELVKATYGPKNLVLVVRVSNGDTSALTIDRDGMLVQYGPLEYPVQRSPDDPPTVDVPPGGERQLVLDFAIGQPVGAQGTLLFRAARRGNTWVRDVEVQIPPPVTSLDET